MSEKRTMPPNTRPVPTQCSGVKGFWKYQMEKRREQNFLKVNTRVTVSDAHSVVKTKTALMQMYWVNVFRAR